MAGRGAPVVCGSGEVAAAGSGDDSLGADCWAKAAVDARSIAAAPTKRMDEDIITDALLTSR
jgi:hypothetical protein